jgi:Tfp pilus assembly protein PilE
MKGFTLVELLILLAILSGTAFTCFLLYAGIHFMIKLW